MAYKIESYEDRLKFEKWAKENGIAFEEMDDGNHCEACPQCGDTEFWSGGHCNHCGYYAE